MAMNKDVLGALLVSKMDAVDPSSYDLKTPSGVAAYRLALAKAQADAIISHIISAAAISVTTTIQPGALATGVTAGAAAVPVTGSTTGTATIT